MIASRQWLLNGHPRGRQIAEDDLKLVTVDIADPGPGQMLLRARWLAFDPAQKGWMENIADYVAPMAIGEVMRGSWIAEVIASNGGKYQPGQLLAGLGTWTEYAVHDGSGLTAVDPALPPTAMMSILGTTGMTAWCGLFKIGKPLPGDTVVISGAAGATGSIVGQLAKMVGCRTIGIAGGKAKCDWLTGELGFDAVIDYKSQDVRAGLKCHAPRGADVVFDNVGGKILDDMLGRIATSARVVICGGISRYETGGTGAVQLPDGPRNYFNLVFRRATMTGFIVVDWAAEFPAIRERVAAMVNDGRLVYREDVQHGFESAPATLQRLFSGKNMGKQLLKLD